MRMGGPREAVWHAIIRRNHGANHFIVGRDHAGPGADSDGKPFYGPYDAQELWRVEAEMGVKMVPLRELVYLPQEDRYEEVDRVPSGATVSISGTEIRETISRRARLPEWFTRPEIARILAEASAAPSAGFLCLVHRAERSGKVDDRRRPHGDAPRAWPPGHRAGRRCRAHSPLQGLGFDKEDRDINVRRIGFVAAEIVRHDGIALCAAVSPYRSPQRVSMVGSDRSSSTSTRPSRSASSGTKGMYAKARQGESRFTGVDDPYERPSGPEIVLTTTDCSPEENARRVIEYLIEQGYVRALEGYNS